MRLQVVLKQFYSVWSVFSSCRSYQHEQNRVTDCGFCSWSWQWFALDKADLPLFVTSNHHPRCAGKLYSLM